jgi:hypothetical protein
MAVLDFYKFFPSQEILVSEITKHALKEASGSDINIVASCLFLDSSTDEEIINVITLFKAILPENLKPNIQFINAIEKVFDRSSKKPYLIMHTIELMQWMCVDMVIIYK